MTFAFTFVPINIEPVVVESRVRAFAPVELIVSAPLSTILFVVNVCEPMTEPVTNVFAPANDCVPVVTTPPNDRDAGSRLST